MSSLMNSCNHNHDVSRSSQLKKEVHSMQQAKSIEVYTPSGILLFKAILTDIAISFQTKSESISEQLPKHEKGNGKSNGAGITDPQKRLLFRLITTNYNLDGDQAFEKLKELFSVGSLKEVSKFEASKMIEHLLEEERGGNHD